ncbi:hypothetical protein [Prescottella defluvii]|uniref:hypothetical protein n=1 Tax=Prescottella defluvii TaxID=1323361 RepID=UPI002F35F8F6
MHAIRGRYGFIPELPTVPGVESVGVIDELDSGVIQRGLPRRTPERVAARRRGSASSPG